MRSFVLGGPRGTVSVRRLLIVEHIPAVKRAVWGETVDDPRG